MNRTLIHVLAASSAVVWSSSARAQEVPPAPPPPVEVAPSAPRPPPPAVIIASTPPRDVATWEEKTPNSGLVGSGILMFGISYGTSVIVASASDRPSDAALYIPLAGPWLDLANRGDCHGVGCDANEAANRVLLVTSGLFQAAGVLQILGGFIFPETRRVTRVAEGVHVTPSAGLGSVGIAAYGAF
jgi:hypothetical protein